MNYYQEITLLPEVEIPLSDIWQRVFQQVHISLVEHKVDKNKSAIAVGFPQYGKASFPLGSKLRLFAKEQAQLEQLNIAKWLSRLEDYTHVKGIKPVPDEVSYVSFTRKNVKSPARVELEMKERAKRRAQKSGKTFDECMAELAETKPEQSNLPFIFLHSQQTKARSPGKSSKYPLFIIMQERESESHGIFDCYGLSAKANDENTYGCVPHF
ncbi:type I-F CRISPR-associated endoribonuclease Cas6/Csy4 [Pseudoalteromonas luteoviolacea]|uniref:type I-F CRISPR-associated endoribonuclease Cas6/Csy4 n=1 Tax=Pseudoalteromonas luteoviolacea TaxID=43657 RepID=UPI001B39691C|nr:type I-F CRISPR-associated endoribonuclease Cas6/Csy4 [Pseudoalteromonas luteoviolacea]MBQ4838017.1 type I-F CRISPR-associated endoribonuclease Cas6/Csy4 [Pseudoalteromonas luteoviolacea]